MSLLQRIFLGNLPWAVTAEEIISLLQVDPKTARVDLPTEPGNPSRKRGFGFLILPLEQAERVLTFNGAEIRGRTLKVALAKQSDKSKPERWQKHSISTSSHTVMHTQPHTAGIPAQVLDRLEAIRLKKDGVSPSQPLLVDIGANRTNFRFKGQVKEVLERATAAGVSRILVTGTSIEESRAACKLVDSYPDVLFATAGVHPHNAKHWKAECSDILEGLLARPDVVAVGETGMDLNRMLSTEQEQKDAFCAQVELACKVGKPLFIHDREAHTHITECLDLFKGRLPPVVIHCFTGTPAEAKRYVQDGYYIGLTGFVCKDERGVAVRQMLKDRVIPLSRLLLETDAPFMTPPLPSGGYKGLNMRTRTNEPCTLPLVAQTVADMCGVSVEEVCSVTTANVGAVFKVYV